MDEIKNETSSEIQEILRTIDDGFDVQSIKTRFENRTCTTDDALNLATIFKNCSSCPMLNYTDPSIQRECICSVCFPLTADFLFSVDIDEGQKSNEDFGYLLSLLGNLISDTIKVKPAKSNLSFEERKAMYMEHWVNAPQKPTMTKLAEEVGVSRRQVYRDFEVLGFAHKFKR